METILHWVISGGNIQVLDVSSQEIVFEQAAQDLEYGSPNSPPQITSLALFFGIINVWLQVIV